MGAIHSLKKNGAKETLRRGCLKAIGIQNYQKEIKELQEEVYTLRYFLNECHDITSLKPTGDVNLRKLQLALLQLMRIFDKMCEQNNLTYFLGYGNLLGAVRHHGFVPWDDDVDVVMPREDYEKVIPLFKDRLEPYGIIVRWGGYYDNMGYMTRLALAYRTLETGVWMDIFPLDCCNAKGRVEDVRAALRGAISEYRSYYVKAQNTESIETIKEKKREIFEQYDILNNGSNKVYFTACEFTKQEIYADEEKLFPLKETEYESAVFKVPYDADYYLKELYGDYMAFPRKGIQHHTDPDGTTAALRAAAHNVDMDDIITYLCNVFEKL